MGRLKALVVVGDGLEDYGDLLAVGRAEARGVGEVYSSSL